MAISHRKDQNQSSHYILHKKNYNLLSLFRKYHTGGLRGPQMDTTNKGNFDGLT